MKQQLLEAALRDLLAAYEELLQTANDFRAETMRADLPEDRAAPEARKLLGD